MISYSSLFICAILSAVTAAEQCEKGCDVPTLIYEDLKCLPKYASAGDCCPQQYDCSHIYNRPEGTCHLRGKVYKVGDKPDEEDTKGNCHFTCFCSENSKFLCPTLADVCWEGWREAYPGRKCYLKYDLNSCCSVGEICPPFDDNIKCEVNGVTYDEGLKFDHPTQKCTKCVCHKGFEGKLEAPFCQKINCTAEIENAADIQNFCAPLYKNSNFCCPDEWICPNSPDADNEDF